MELKLYRIVVVLRNIIFPIHECEITIASYFVVAVKLDSILRCRKFSRNLLYEGISILQILVSQLQNIVIEKIKSMNL